MKKLNNKGMTLVELIVSFAIVTVAVVYFSQSLITTSKLFKNTKEETDAYVEEVYVYRLLEAMFKEYSQKSQLGIAGNKFVGFDTIFIYCGVIDPANITSLFSLDSSVQNGSWSIYPRNVNDEKLKSIGITEYKRHPSFGWEKVGGKNCDVLNPDGINSDFYVLHNNFKGENYWIPIEYYDYFGEVGRDVTGGWPLYLKWNIWKKNSGNHFGISNIDNYYNPALKMFVSIATMNSGKKYKYYTEFNYEDYINSGKEIRYFLTYQLGEKDVRNSNNNSNYKNTVRVKNFCSEAFGCNADGSDE